MAKDSCPWGCGRVADTWEDIVPMWLLGTFPLGTFTYTQGELYEAPGAGRIVKTAQLKRRVCRECNNGWMSKVEAEAKQAVSQLIFERKAAKYFRWVD
jgi:hypothetical protein